MKTRSTWSAALVLLCLSALCACAPRIHFPLDRPAQAQRPSLFVDHIADARPVPEHVGYKIFYADSITDGDYEQGFVPTFAKGLREALRAHFTLANNSRDADLHLDVTVRHFYGEFVRPFNAVVFEYLSFLCLGLPRLVGDFVPYNAFAGRVALDLHFRARSGQHWTRQVEARVYRQVPTHRRSPAATAAMLSEAVADRLHRVLAEIASGEASLTP